MLTSLPSCLRHVQGDDTPGEEPKSHLSEAADDEKRRQLLGTGEAADAGGQVRVGRAARKHAAEHRDDAVEPEPVEGRERARGRVISRIPSRPPGRSTRRSSRRPALEVVDVADPEADGDGVECRVLERQREHVARDPLDGGRLPARPLEHRLREVEADDVRAAAERRDREVAGAAARVEDAVARPDDGLDGHAAPAPVEPGGHHAVHRVVDRGDAVEHPPHAVGGKPALDSVMRRP